MFDAGRITSYWNQDEKGMGAEQAKWLGAQCGEKRIVDTQADRSSVKARGIDAGTLSWSSFFGHRDRLFDCRLLLEGIGWQVAQFGVQPHAVVEAHDVVGDVCHGLGVVGVVALPDPLRLEA